MWFCRQPNCLHGYFDGIEDLCLHQGVGDCSQVPPQEGMMISFQRLARYVGAEPFRPFRISMASGQTFEIRHPEMISLGRSTAYIFTFMTDEVEKSKQREHEVSLLLMESVEPLDATPAQGGNR
jgi:hypothetical protein